MARQGLYRDNQANVYALPVLAYQSGHSKFLLADELTKRRLIWKSHAGEGSALSVILISVNEKPAIPEGIPVWARRETALIITSHKCLQKSSTHGSAIQSQMKQGPSMMAISSRDKYGKSEDLRFMTPIAQFSTDTKDSLGWESYLEAMVAALSRLPVELAIDIVSHTGDARIIQNTLCRAFDHIHPLSRKF